MKRYPKPTKMLGKNLGQRGNNLNPKHLGRRRVLRDEEYLLVVCRHCILPQPLVAAPVESVTIRYVMFQTKCSTVIVAYVASAVGVPSKHGYPFTRKIFAGRPTRHPSCIGPQITVSVISVQPVEGL